MYANITGIFININRLIYYNVNTLLEKVSYY